MVLHRELNTPIIGMLSPYMYRSIWMHAKRLYHTQISDDISRIIVLENNVSILQAHEHLN